MTPLPVGKTVLLVDDDEKILGILAHFLRQAGYEVRSTSDPLKAVALAAECRPDLAILDVTMPHLNGFDLAVRLSSNRSTSKLPFMFLSAAGATLNIKDAKAVRAAAYLQKPFRKDVLLDTIGKILSGELGEAV